MTRVGLYALFAAKLTCCAVAFGMILGWCAHRMTHGPGELRVTLRVERIDGRCW